MEAIIAHKTHDKVIEYLNDQIKTKALGQGDQLPSERVLSEQLQVSRAAIRETYKILHILGIVEHKPGSGSFFKDRVAEWASEPTELVFKLAGVTHREVVEFRRMIEAETATLAAQRITDEEIVELRRCYKNMVQADEEALKSHVDKEFHFLIAKASKNHIIMNAYNAMMSLMEQFTLNVRADALRGEGREAVDKLHRDIYLAVISRDSEAARASMVRHMKMMIQYAPDR